MSPTLLRSHAAQVFLEGMDMRAVMEASVEAVDLGVVGLVGLAEGHREVAGRVEAGRVKRVRR